MFNLDEIVNDNNKVHNEKQPYIPEHPDWILINGGSGSRKTNTLLNLIGEQNNIDKMYLYAKGLSELKYEFLIKKSKTTEIKHINNPNAFIECLNTVDGVYDNIDGYNQSRTRKILIVFNDMIADAMTKIFKP